MRESMDDVLQYLVSQIALNGNSGASPADFLKFLDTYTSNSQSTLLRQSHDLPGVAVRERNQDLSKDPLRRSAIWQWLTQYHGILVGANNDFNQMSLAGVEDYNHKILAACLANHENSVSAKSGQDPEEIHCSKSLSSPIIKLRANEELVWHAVAGHEPDHSRIPSRDFECLCIIAKHREAGILQPSLVRLSGQDARSVPTRTQRLCDAGYVVKIRTLSRGAWTSLLILKKFAQKVPNIGDPDADFSHYEVDPRDSLGRGKYDHMQHKLRDTMRILAETRLIVWDDLKRKVGVFEDGEQSRALAAACRELELLGYVQRVKAQSELGEGLGKFHRCLKFLRQPSEQEFKAFFSGRLSFENENQAKLEASTRPQDPTTETWGLSLESNVEKPLGAPLFSEFYWRPHRQMSHIMRDIIDAAGEDGATLPNIREAAVGPFYDRPLEHLLGRLVEFPGISQPRNLDHLGIIRDTIAIGRTNMYIHFAEHRLKSLMESGKIQKDAEIVASWSHGGQDRTDNFGFPKLDNALLQMPARAKSLHDCACYPLHQLGSINIRPEKATGSAPSGRPRGRPRKYPREGMPSGIPLNSPEFKSILRSQAQAKKYEGNKEDTNNEEFGVMLEEVAASDENPNSTVDHGTIETICQQGRPGRPKGSTRASHAQAPSLFSPKAQLHGLQRQGSTPDHSPGLSYCPSFFSHFIPQSEQYGADCIIVGFDPKWQRLLGALENMPISVILQGNVMNTEAKSSGGTTRSNAARITKRFSPTSAARHEGFTYAQQERFISRPKSGIFVGRVQDLAKPRARGRRPKSRLAIIKTPQLQQLSWFREPLAIDSTSRAPVRSAQHYTTAEHGTPNHVSKSRNMNQPIRSARGGSVNDYVSAAFRAKSHEGTVETSANSLDVKATDSGKMHADPVAHKSTHSDSIFDFESRAVEEPIPGLRKPSVQHEHGRINELSPYIRHSEAADDVTELSKASGGLDRNGLKLKPRVGGSVAAIRRKIILDIVHKAGGCYPGNNEMWYPFTTLWMQKHPDTRPDHKTIRSATKALVDAGKLKRISFNFQNKIGVLLTKNILTLPEVQPQDDRVLFLQEKMKSEDPRYYFPDGPLISPDLKGSIRKSEASSVPLQIENEKVSLHHIPVYLRKRKASRMEDFHENGAPKRLRTLFGRNNARVEHSMHDPLSSNIENITGHQRLELSPSAREAIDVQRDMERESQSDMIAEYTPAMFNGEEPLMYVNSLSCQQDEEASEGQSESYISTFGYRTYYPAAWNTLLGKKLTASQLTAQEENPVPYPGPKRKPRREEAKPRRLASMLRKYRATQVLPSKENQPIKQFRARGPNTAKIFEDFNMRMYVATILNKILVGGIEQNIDWSLVESTLGNRISAQRIRSKWNYIRASFANVAQTLQDDLRALLIRAYEENLVPLLDYSTLRDYDWEQLLEWVMENLDHSLLHTGLPTSRARLDKEYDVQVISNSNQINLQEDAAATSIPRRRFILHEHAYVTVVPESPLCVTVQNLVPIARSWIRAVVATPEQEYDCEFTRRKLEILGEDLVNDAVKALRANKLLAQENKGRPSPKRAYDFSDWYLSKLATNPDTRQLKDAAKFKHIIDRHFEQHDSMVLDMNSPDGAFLALVNMLGHDHIEVRQVSGLPERQGLIESGYQTRRMDRSRLILEVKLLPGKTFKWGNPLNLSEPPPRGESFINETGVDMTPIPMWLDVNGNDVPLMWDVAKATVALLLSQRPLLTAHSMAELLRNFLEVFEIQLVFSWLVNTGAAEWVSDNHEEAVLRPWWWMILDDTVKQAT